MKVITEMTTAEQALFRDLMKGNRRVSASYPPLKGLRDKHLVLWTADRPGVQVSPQLTRKGRLLKTRWEQQQA